MVGMRRAAIVGVDVYLDQAIPNLLGSINDATEVKNILERHGDFEIEKKHFLIGEAVTAETIRKALSDLFWSSENADLVLFYFAGHGFVDNYGNGYIAPYNMIRDAPLVHGIRVQEIRDLLLRSPFKKFGIVILDCCHSSIATDNERAVDENLSRTFERFSSDFEVSTQGSRLIISSAGSDHKARELIDCTHGCEGVEPHAHGQFTYHFLCALEGAAQDKTGLIRIGKILDYMRTILPEKDWPRRFISNDTGCDDIVICRSTEIFSQYVDSKISEYRDIVEDSPKYITNAVRLYGEIFDLAPERCTSELTDMLAAQIDDLKVKLQHWYYFIFFRSIQEISKEARADLEYIVDGFDIALIRQVNGPKEALMQCLLKTVVDGKDVSYFTSTIQTLRRTPSSVEREKVRIAG